MTEKEIEETLGTPFPVLHALCQSSENLRLILSRAVNEGVSKGQAQMNLNFNKMLFRGYDKTTIVN